MSYGIEEAALAVTEGSLLGQRVGRKGLRVQEAKTKAVTAFLPLREKLHVQQFLGCMKFFRFYMPPQQTRRHVARKHHLRRVYRYVKSESEVHKVIESSAQVEYIESSA